MTISLFHGPCVVAEFRTKKAADNLAKRVIANQVKVIRCKSKYDPQFPGFVYQVIAIRGGD